MFISGIYPGAAGHYTYAIKTIHKVGHALVENGQPVLDNNTYSTHLYTQKTIEYVDTHLRETPDKVKPSSIRYFVTTFQDKYS